MSRRPAAVKNLVCFLGPPASGKGSYSKLCTETFRRLNQPVSRFIASDLIRAEMAAGTTAGLAMKPFMEQHRHVPSELIVDVVWRNLEGLGEEGEGKRGVILDGFPRSTEQAELFLRGVSGAGGIKGESGEGAGRAVRLSGVHLDLRESWARQKAIGRVVCRSCGYSYNDARIEEGDFVWEADMPAGARSPAPDHVSQEPDCSSRRVGGTSGGRGAAAAAAPADHSPSCRACSAHPLVLERRESAAIFDGRYRTYLETEKPVLDLLRKPSTGLVRDLPVVGGYRVMARQVLTTTAELLELDLEEGELVATGVRVLDEWGVV